MHVKPLSALLDALHPRRVAAVDEIKQAVQYLREGGASKVRCSGRGTGEDGPV